MGKRPTRRDAVLESTRCYEAWLAQHGPVVRPSLRLKHQRMAESPFAFFRATFYRWVETWRQLDPALDHAPRVLAVGDLHVENFGTWRDAEGRLAWGVNDFDEAYPAPYTLDLARLAVSARLAAEEARLSVGLRGACEAILEGYREGLQDGGDPFVLADRHPWLRDIAVASARDPARFWAKMVGLPRFRGTLPREVSQALDHLIPPGCTAIDRRSRMAGLGSLGHVRMVALAMCQGAWLAREVKALAPSALSRGHPGAPKSWAGVAMARAIRAGDPFVRAEGWWLLRRLAPDCSRIELADLPAKRDEVRLLRNMGRETANVHLGSPGAKGRILKHLAGQRTGWLREVAGRMAETVSAEAEAWRGHWARDGR